MALALARKSQVKSDNVSELNLIARFTPNVKKKFQFTHFPTVNVPMVVLKEDTCLTLKH